MLVGFMHLLKLLGICGFISMLFGATLIVPAAVSFWYQDGEIWHFIYPMQGMFLIGFLLWPLSRDNPVSYQPAMVS